MQESNDSEEPVLYTRKAWPLSPDILAQTSLKNSEQVSSPFANASDSGLSLVSPDGRSSSSLSDSEQVSFPLFSFLKIWGIYLRVEGDKVFYYIDTNEIN